MGDTTIIKLEHVLFLFTKSKNLPGVKIMKKEEILEEVINEVLCTEYSEKFDKLRKDRMIVSYYKYGPVKTNYQQKYINAIESLKLRLKMYEDTGNTEFLCDISNLAMIEFMYPQHANAHFKVLDDGKSHIVGMGVNEIERYGK